MPHISVVIPVYKAEECLHVLYERIKDSLETITQDFELILVEDCGGDRSWDIITELANSDSRVRGVNPKPDSKNLLLNLETSFIEENKVLDKILKQILGGYNILLKKIVCGLPDTCIPDWVIEIVKNQPIPNLGAYIDKKYQDITYFRGIDWHQDIIDYPQHDPRFITLYIYLHDVGNNDAPLWVIPKSHLLGATKFPHNIKLLQGGELI